MIVLYPISNNAPESPVSRVNIKVDIPYLFAINSIPTNDYLPNIDIQDGFIGAGGATIDYDCPIVKQCVFYAVQKSGIRISGNANQWPERASEYGYGFYQEPKVGSVVSLVTKNKFGHLGYVENIQDGKLYLSEQNYISCGIISERILELTDEQILGYIY